MVEYALCRIIGNLAEVLTVTNAVCLIYGPTSMHVTVPV